MGKAYNRFTFRHGLLLAAPHTWSASIVPVLAACSFAIANGCTISVISLFVLLAISILMQSSVNAFNDYMDYRKGSDSKDDDVDPSDAVLVYESINPRDALVLACSFMCAAFLLGIYCIIIAGWIPLFIALAGALIVFLYSGTKTPISYLPIGEAVSGFVMGGLIALASYMVITLRLDFMVLVWSIPVMLGIALIMMTNNGCDISKDVLAGRRTLPVMLGHRRTREAYRILIAAWYVCYAVVIAIWFPAGIITVPIAVLTTIPLLKALWANPLLPKTRQAAMSQVISMNIALGAFFCLSVVASLGVLTVV